MNFGRNPSKIMMETIARVACSKSRANSIHRVIFAVERAAFARSYRLRIEFRKILDPNFAFLLPNDFGIDQRALFIIIKFDAAGQGNHIHQAKTSAIRRTVMHLALDQKLAMLVEKLAAAQPGSFAGRRAPLILTFSGVGRRLWDNAIGHTAIALDRAKPIDLLRLQKGLRLIPISGFDF